MERESFENPDIGKILSDHFVAIKVHKYIHDVVICGCTNVKYTNETAIPQHNGMNECTGASKWLSE